MRFVLHVLSKSVKLLLVRESNLSLDNLVIKSDAIFLEFFHDNVSTVTSPDRAPDSSRHTLANSFIPSTSSTNKTSGSDCFNPSDVLNLC